MSRILVCFAVFLFVSCSSLPEKTEAIHNALTTDAALREAAVLCGSTGLEVRRQATREQLDWWQRNRAYVLGADYGLLDLNWARSNENSEQPRAVLAMQTLEHIQTDSVMQLQRWLGEQASAGECNRLFERVADGKLDLDSPRDQADLLTGYYQNRQSLSADTASARSINSRYRKYGRSLFIVEKELQETGCSDPTISLLRNAWPIEVYDAVCQQDDYLLVKCEWGRCDVKR